MLRVVKCGQLLDLASLEDGDTSFVRIADDSGAFVDLQVRGEDLQALVRLAVSDRAPRREPARPEIREFGEEPPEEFEDDPGTGIVADPGEEGEFETWGGDSVSPFTIEEDT